MSENDAPVRLQQDPAKVWDELDDYTRSRVIEMFGDMAFRAIVTKAKASTKSLLSEDAKIRLAQKSK